MRAMGYVRVSAEDQARERVPLEAKEAKIRVQALLRDSTTSCLIHPCKRWRKDATGFIRG